MDRFSQPRFAQPASEDDLFGRGVCSFRMDVGTFRDVSNILEEVPFVAPPAPLPEFDGWVCERPLGKPTDFQRKHLMQSLETMVNNVALFPCLRQLGFLRVVSLEVQDGSFDDAWHHDGLVGKRNGHPGDFFLIAYFGEPLWRPEWGGQFECAPRSLLGNWTSEAMEPCAPAVSIEPQERTVLMGWNQNPVFVHRALPLRAPVKRVSVIASVNLERQD